MQTRARLADAYFDTFVRDSGDHVVGSRFDCRGEPALRDLELQGNGGPLDERVERSPKATVGEDGRMDAACELAKVGERLGELVPCGREERRRGRGIGGDLALGESE